MRLWSLHPRYLDSRGLVALWREGLLALAVLRGETVGYRHHPQLIRFAKTDRPVGTLRHYLSAVYEEACDRGYAFDRTKLGRAPSHPPALMIVSTGQLAYEWQHLLRKLYRRARSRWSTLQAQGPTPHPLFRVRQGPIAEWERR